MSNNPYRSPDSAGQSPPHNSGDFIGRFVTTLAVICVVVVLIGLLLPALRYPRESARHATCGSQLRNIALALQAYESVYHALPPPYTVDAEGKPLHSWRTLILPYVGQQLLYRKIDLSKSWDDPVNNAAYETTPSIYRCPSAVIPSGHTTYLAVVAPNGCFHPTRARKLAEITDSPGMTLMIVEVGSDQAVHWMCPTDIGEERILDPKTFPNGPHSGQVQAVCVDGRVLQLSKDSKPDTLRAMISIGGQDDAVAQEAN